MQYSHTYGILGCLAIAGIIFGLGPYSTPDMFVPDKGKMWYYWQLENPTFLSRASAWSLYFLHQISLFGLIAYAQIKRPKYSKALNPFNIIAIIVNVVFVFLHIAQTRIWYDGLAQDVPIWTSQFSAIFLLIFVLLMENSRRGLFFGKKIEWVDQSSGFIKRYHGYYFSWAIIYTFWFHPIEDNLGHLLGTFYTLMLLLQGSLFFTRFHTNRYWTVLLETFVVVHGVIVAYLSAKTGNWPMYLFGFLGIFVITQMHGLGLGNKTRWAIGIGYIIGVFIVYGTDFTRMAKIATIPLADYALVFLFAMLAWIPIFLTKHIKRYRSAKKRLVVPPVKGSYNID